MNRSVVVIGGSAGAIQALRDLLPALPADLPASVLIVVHTSRNSPGVLPSVLQRRSALPVAAAVHGQRLEHGRVYVAPPDRHLMIRDGHLRLNRSARVNRVRPAVDVLFRSAARWSGPAAIGIVLSGVLDDGAAGLAAITACGGLALVQDPADAFFDGMPRAALSAVAGQATIGSPDQLAATLTDLVGQPVPGSPVAVPLDLILEDDMAQDGHTPDGRVPGRPAMFGCPDCGGAMAVVDLNRSTHYRCHVGHSFSPLTLLAAQEEKVENALWTAVAYLEEKAAIHRQLAGRADGPTHAAAYDTPVLNSRLAAEEALRAAEVIREQLNRHGSAAADIS